MYRNSIENLLHILNSKSTANKMIVGVHGTLTNDLTKCNYMEYIRGIEKWLQSPLKGTIQRFSHKGTSECEIILDIGILKLLDFSIYPSSSLYSFKTRWGRGLVQKVKHLTTYLTLSVVSVWALLYE
jgi:hypothetical protein